MYAPMALQNIGAEQMGSANAVMPAARQMFERALLAGGVKRALAAVTRRSRRLHVLAEVSARIVNRHYLGAQTVALDRIVGTLDKADSFDCEFYPLRADSAERWAGVAGALLRGQTLPLVELIQVGEQYYVSDGHHRISVARAMGQAAIEANVMRWKTA